MKQIIVFGSSVTYGAWDENGGWVQRLRCFLEDKRMNDKGRPAFLVYNLGVSGDTVEDILERMEFEIEERIEGNKETVLVFEIGLDDSAIIKKNKNLVPLSRFVIKIKNIIELCSKYRSKIILVGPTSVDESKTSPVPFRKKVIYRNETIEKYNKAIKEECEKNNIFFVDIFSRMISMDYKVMLKDGLYPDSDGHKFIYETIGDFLVDHDII